MLVLEEPLEYMCVLGVRRAERWRRGRVLRSLVILAFVVYKGDECIVVRVDDDDACRLGRMGVEVSRRVAGRGVLAVAGDKEWGGHGGWWMDVRGCGRSTSRGFRKGGMGWGGVKGCSDHAIVGKEARMKTEVGFCCHYCSELAFVLSMS